MPYMDIKREIVEVENDLAKKRLFAVDARLRTPYATPFLPVTLPLPTQHLTKLLPH